MWSKVLWFLVLRSSLDLKTWRYTLMRFSPRPVFLVFCTLLRRTLGIYNLCPPSQRPVPWACTVSVFFPSLSRYLFFLSFDLFSSPFSPSACSGSFIPVGGECLAFLTSYGTWYNQLSACVMAPNASLAKVTGDLHNAIYEYIKDTPGESKRALCWGLWDYRYKSGMSDGTSPF